MKNESAMPILSEDASNSNSPSVFRVGLVSVVFNMLEGKNITDCIPYVGLDTESKKKPHFFKLFCSSWFVLIYSVYDKFKVF